ncbi:uncharacterized protein LOC106469504 [Limulus polyphemus]|uniref:Uncharacterized protein LOC106469504 n=1 Tax=Limulus polyphemus TaxID=6850 RepID=A0ABM1BNB5_LIMPO|nr:uncharacterized protein LOC106469504 [Limulus polyphemus]
MTFLGRTILIITWIPVAFTVTVTPLSRVDNGQFQGPSIRLTRWAEAAVNFVQNLNCTEVFLTRERECRKLVQVPRDQMNLYAAGPISRGRLAAVLPDGALSRSGAHNVVLVLDPYPRASFGHLVVVFFLDTLWSELQCQVNGGFYIGQGDCLSLALKNRCHNLLGRRPRRRNLVRRCEINFLPFVHLADHPPRGQEDQLLTCYDNIPGFASCPSFRPENETTQLACDPLHVNTQRCSTTHETVHTRCRISEICDQAVLLSGGWNRLSSNQESLNDLKSVFQMLRNVGFPKRNIKVFFANGAENFQVLGGESHPLYPSVFKLALRYHVKKLCESPHCVDTLVLYLNSPAMNDGSSLLWDTDGNGQVGEDETFTVGEIMVDLENCTARQVFIIADQSYSGQLIKSFNRSTRHNNVQVFTSGKEREYSWQVELTKHWVSFGHQHSCVSQVYQVS